MCDTHLAKAGDRHSRRPKLSIEPVDAAVTTYD